MRKGQRKPRLYLDSATCHKKAELTSYLADLNIQLSFIPPRLTHLLQPPDVCWFKSIKRMYHERWTNWYISDPKSFNRNLNLMSPGYKRAILWLAEIWDNFDPSIIRSSFDVCGITSTNREFFHQNLSTMLTHNILFEENVEEDDGESYEVDGLSGESDYSSDTSEDGDKDEDEDNDSDYEQSIDENGDENEKNDSDYVQSIDENQTESDNDSDYEQSIDENQDESDNDSDYEQNIDERFESRQESDDDCLNLDDSYESEDDCNFEIKNKKVGRKSKRKNLEILSDDGSSIEDNICLANRPKRTCTLRNKKL